MQTGVPAGQSGQLLDDKTQTISGLGQEPTGRTGKAISAAAHPGELPAGAALLVVRRGPNAGSRFVLDIESSTAGGAITVGRHPDSDILLDDVTVSRHHAEFRQTPQGWQIVDSGSLNGTYLNRQRIEVAMLVAGDEVQIGKFQMVVAAAGSQEGSR